MKLTDLDAQTILDLKEALSRRFSSAEDRAVLFEAAGLSVKILKGTDLSKFWEIMLKNIENNELATHRLLQAAVDLRPTDYNLRTIHRLFIGPRRKLFPIKLLISVPFIFISFYFLFDFLGSANLQKTSSSNQSVIEPSMEKNDLELPSQQDTLEEKDKAAEPSSVEQEEKTVSPEEVPTPSEEKIAEAITASPSPKNTEKTSIEKQNTTSSKPEELAKSTAPIQPPKATENKATQPKTQASKTQAPKTQVPKTQAPKNTGLVQLSLYDYALDLVAPW